jgi:DNA polymerase I-like protein with 3'-5' exonuclease and polymerase domains
MTHADHLAQVPKIKKDREGNILRGYEGRYGFESRDLFGAPPGKKLVGVDADGLELRMLGHYMARFDGGAYARAVVDGDKRAGTDAHSLNMKAVRLRTRDGAKTWVYAYLYGAGDLKLGKTFYEDMADAWREGFNAKHPGSRRERAWMQHGKQGRSRIEQGFPALGELQKGVKAKAKQRSPKLRSLDGRLLHIRAQHSALNTLLQGAGAVVMKKALVLAYDAFLERGWVFGREFAFVLNVHDEFQMEVMPEYAEEVGAIAADAIRRAGEAFGLRVPLAGSSDIGQTWADTH